VENHFVWQRLKPQPQRPSPRLPDGIRIYAVGDVHGRADLLDQVLSRIDADLAADPDCRPIQIFLGDYIDRGPSSRGVLDRLIKRSYAHEIVCLKGNHEGYVFEFLQNPTILNDWRQFGGLETLMSYGLKPSINADSAEQAELAKALAASLPRHHREFLKSLSPSFTCGDFFFVHAGVKPGVPLDEQREEDLLWIRDDFLFCEEDFGKIIVHGHTPVRDPDVRSNRINIDTGAYATGRLTCLIIESDEIFVL
jgi:serine/threonine protein phosphatase 1